MKLNCQKQFLILILLISPVFMEKQIIPEDSSLVLDPNTDQTFEIYITDGQKIVTFKTIDFKQDGMFENGKLLMKYDSIESINDKKCHVENNFVIVPPKFVEEKLYFPSCIAKIKYNSLLTFLGSKDSQCKEIMGYIVAKMRKSCLKAKNGPKKIFKLALQSNPAQGKWKGHVFYSSIPENAPLKIGSSDFFMLTVEDSLLKVSDTTGMDKYIFYKNFNWGCNEDGDCSIEDYIYYLKRSRQKSKIPPIKAMAKEIVKQWDMQDNVHCLIIEELDTHVICPNDIAEEAHLKKAMSRAFDAYLINSKIERFLLDPLKDGSDPNEKLSKFHRVIHSTASRHPIKDYEIEVLSEGVKDAHSGKYLLKYSHIKPINGFQCGIEFRFLSLPNEYHEINPLCCAKYITSESNYICTQQQSKCYLPLRRLILQLRKACLISQESLLPPTSPEDSFAMDVLFVELDNFKYRGTPRFHEGVMSLSEEEVSFRVKHKEIIKYSIINLNFLCEGPFPCSIPDFRKTQDKFLERGLDKEWQDTTFDALSAAYPKVDVTKDCMVLIFDISSYEIANMVVTCSKIPRMGLKVKERLMDFYNRKAGKINDEIYPQFHDAIPFSFIGKEIPAYVIPTTKTDNPDNIEPSKTILAIDLAGLQYKASAEFLLKFPDLLFMKDERFVAEKTMKIFLEDLPRRMQDIKEINPKCCFRLNSPADNVYFICVISGKRCLFDKLSMFKFSRDHLERTFILQRKEIEEKQQVLDSHIQGTQQFSFGLSPHFRSFAPGFNYGLLHKDTFDYSPGGVWRGWVYESAFTMLNAEDKITPVFMRIEEGLITFYVDEDESLRPYKTLVLNQYNQRCRNHCSPAEYLDYQKTKKVPFDEIIIMEKSIDNVLTQKHTFMLEKGCIVMDFTSPHHNFGHSHIICTVDREQGKKIRVALDFAYYEALLTMEMAKHVRTPFRDNDKYLGRLIINNKLMMDFNLFYLSGDTLKGVRMKDDGTVIPPDNAKPFEFRFKHIANDNFGLRCAFWYRNMKIRERNPELRQLVPDNNCCFRFYSRDKDRYEICTFLPNNQNCIKQARELMKGMKKGCMVFNKYNPLAVLKDKETQQNQNIYVLKGFDDAENGHLNGFMYAGSLFDASQQTVSNPYYAKIDKDGILMYVNHTDLNTPKIMIPTTHIQFFCNEKSLCTPSTFEKFAALNARYSSYISAIRTVYHLFQDVYSLDSARFEYGCFILETVSEPYLICTSLPETTHRVKLAITNAYLLFYSDISLTNVKIQDHTTNIYHIIYSTDELEAPMKYIIQLSHKGIIDTLSKNVISPLALDRDPLTNNQCAIWYQNIKIPFPHHHPECCFQISVNRQLETFCIEDSLGCKKTALELIKEIYEACSTNALKNTMELSPDSQILGDEKYAPKIVVNAENERDDICPLIHPNMLIPESLIRVDLITCLYNDISYSEERAEYRGWFNFYPMDLSGGHEKFKPQKLYGELTIDGFNFFVDPNRKRNPKVSVRPELLTMSCGRGEACRPLQYAEYAEKYEKFYAYLKESIKSVLDMYEMGHDAGCTVLENTVDGKLQYYYICPRIRKIVVKEKEVIKHLDPMTSAYTKERTAISEYFGIKLRKILYDTYMITRKLLNDGKLPIHMPQIKMAKMTFQGAVKTVNGMMIAAEGVYSGDQVILNYRANGNCKVHYNLMTVPSQVTFNNRKECCVKVKGGKSEEIICNNQINCDYVALAFAKAYKDKCNSSLQKNDPTHNQFNTGDRIDILDIIKRLIAENIHVTDVQRMSKNTSLQSEEFLGKHLSIASKYFLEVRDILHAIQKSDITNNEKPDINANNEKPDINANNEKTESPKPSFLEFAAEVEKDRKAKKKKIKQEPNSGEALEVEKHQEMMLLKQGLVENNAETEKYSITETKAGGLLYKDKVNGNAINVIDDNLYMKTKDFVAIFADNAHYVVIVYNEDGQKIFELGKNILLTDSRSFMPKLKSLEVNMKTAGIEISE